MNLFIQRDYVQNIVCQVRLNHSVWKAILLAEKLSGLSISEFLQECLTYRQFVLIPKMHSVGWFPTLQPLSPQSQYFRPSFAFSMAKVQKISIDLRSTISDLYDWDNEPRLRNRMTHFLSIPIVRKTFHSPPFFCFYLSKTGTCWTLQSEPRQAKGQCYIYIHNP